MTLKYPDYIEKLYQEIRPFYSEHGGLVENAPEDIKEKREVVLKWVNEQRRIADTIEIKSDPASYFKKSF